LFTQNEDDAPLLTAPRPPRPPLAVRRPTLEIPRTRARTLTPRPEDDDEFSFPSEATLDQTQPGGPAEIAGEEAAVSSVRRVIAAALDIALLGAIDAAVVYLTLALAGLDSTQIRVLPLLPLATFLVILDGGYLVAFVAACGQTIGKMATGIRVIRDDGGRVDVKAALLRAAGCGLSLLTAGVGYLPAFVMTDRRALHDRISGTRVVSAR
jgi:uncharacterized RDD family membrane protein YckC